MINLSSSGFALSGIFESIQLAICKIDSTIPILQIGKVAERKKQIVLSLLKSHNNVVVKS